MVYEISMPLNFLFGHLILIILNDLVPQDINNNENSSRHCSSALHVLTISSSQQHSEVGTIIISFGNNLSEAMELKTCSQDLNLGFVHLETLYIVNTMIEIMRREQVLSAI